MACSTASFMILFKEPEQLFGLLFSLSSSVVVLHLLQEIIQFPVHSSMLHTIKELGGWVLTLIVMYKAYVEMNDSVNTVLFNFDVFDFNVQSSSLSSTHSAHSADPNVEQNVKEETDWFNMFSLRESVSNIIVSWMMVPAESVTKTILDSLTVHIGANAAERYLMKNKKVIVMFSIWNIFQYFFNNKSQKKYDRNCATIKLKIKDLCSAAEINIVDLTKHIAQELDIKEINMDETRKQMVVKYVEELNKRKLKQEEQKKQKLEKILPPPPSESVNSSKSVHPIVSPDEQLEELKKKLKECMINHK